MISKLRGVTTAGLPGQGVDGDGGKVVGWCASCIEGKNY